MNAFDSEQCSSGCESGWTLYLEQSFLNQNASHGGDTRFTTGFYEEHKEVENSGEEEDLSMVSDASSGPPHDDGVPCFNEEHNGFFHSASSKVMKKLAKNGKKKERVKKNQHHKIEDQYLPPFLHDTASSHHFDFSTNNVTGTNQQNSTDSMMDYSQGSSATYFGGSSSFQEEEHFGFLQPSLSGNELQGNKWKGIGMR